MIAQPDSTADTMLRALSTSMASLEVAAELDVDRSPQDREFFAQERSALQPHFEAVSSAQQALTRHDLLTSQALQAAIVLGDAVLDRGVRLGKRRMALELANVDHAAADKIFGQDLTELVEAERRVEPQLVLEALKRFSQVPDFQGKDTLYSDLEGRAKRQAMNFDRRDAGQLNEAELRARVVRAVADASNALYRLEKRLLERFPRERPYVRAFFLDVAPARKKNGSPTP